MVRNRVVFRGIHHLFYEVQKLKPGILTVAPQKSPPPAGGTAGGGKLSYINLCDCSSHQG
jgi:hypothetical protein